jgi:hypothetical protein
MFSTTEAKRKLLYQKTTVPVLVQLFYRLMASGASLTDNLRNEESDLLPTGSVLISSNSTPTGRKHQIQALVILATWSEPTFG